MRDLARAQGAAKAAAMPSARAMEAAKRMGLSFGSDGKPKPLTRDEMRKIAESLDKLPPELLARLEKEGVKIELRDYGTHGFQVEGIGQPARPERKPTDYALTNPREYFSEGFRMYLQSPETRAQLRERDPNLFRRLQGILGSR